MPAERYIERSFPIVQVNPLSVRERNAFKPVYTMHKWFARRSSSIFRAILLGAALPYEDDQGRPTDLMSEFYKGHGEDPRLRRPDGTPLKVLDPFMGGGTTVVEALRLGLEVTGIDYNPVAWFIVRGETTPVDLTALDAAYQRVAAKVKEPLLDLYRTRCPLTGQPADIIYGFWVKQGVCVAPDCGKVTDLFKSYVVAQKRGDASLRYLADVRCTACGLVFDWELERCTITAGGPQIPGGKPAGKGRPEGTRFAFGLIEHGVDCPGCGTHGRPGSSDKPKTKSVPLHVVVDPSSGDFFEVRGDLPDRVTAPTSGHSFAPGDAPVGSAGKFACVHCGRKQAIVESADRLGRPLSFRYYGFYAYSAAAEAKGNSREARQMGLPTNNHKWFAAVGPEDRKKVADAEAELAQVRSTLPLPEQEIPEGRNFRDLRRQSYRRWSEVYGPRQLLALGRLLKAIGEEPDPVLRDALLGAFQSTLSCQSNLCRYNLTANKIEGVTSAHDYRNPTTIAENPVWGAGEGIGRGTFSNYQIVLRQGLAYSFAPDLSTADSTTAVDDVVPTQWTPRVVRGSCTDISQYSTASFDLIITDPPYAGSVQYAEMSDWSYVWLHQVLQHHYPDEFGSEITLKSQEIIENNADKDKAFFFEHLTQAWRECHRVLQDDGLLVFTFHHKEGDRWSGLLKSLFDAGFYLVAAYPTHSEALNSIVIQATEGITYDIIHVCRKRLSAPEPIPWTRLRREVLQESRAQLKEIEGGRDVLPGPDVRMILLGKALRRFSQHYGAVLDADGQPLTDLAEAIERISLLVREVRGEELPLPGVLREVDSVSQAAFLHVVGKGPWSRDDLHKELRGFAQGLDRLLEDGLVRERKGYKGQLEAVPALERYGSLGKRQGGKDAHLIDRLHLLLGTIHAGQDPNPLLTSWGAGEHAQREPLREGLSALSKADPALRELCGLALRALEVLPAQAPRGKSIQTELFGTKA